MASDDQRREVAARMREIMRRDPHGFLDIMVARSVLDVMGEGMRIGETLADLIDRPTCETIEHGRPDESHVCKSCSRCSYGWFEDIHDKPYSYCPNCGAVVTDKEEDDD